MKILITLLIAVGMPLLGYGQTAQSFILQGRGLLTVKDLTNATLRFAEAVSLAPNDQTANALLAGTRLLSLPYHRSTEDLLDRLGVAQTNRSVYRWTANLPRDKHHGLVPPNDFNAEELVAFVKTNILVEVEAALANAAKITDRNFILVLSKDETTRGEVIVDYGDVQMAMSYLHAVQIIGLTLNSLNLDLQLNALYGLNSRGELTLERILADYPLLLMYTDSNSIEASKASFQAAVARYLAASEFIRTRPPNVTRVFLYDPDVAARELRFRTTLIELTNSLVGPARLTYFTNQNQNAVVDLSKSFSTNSSIRSILPQFQGNQMILGTFSPEIDLGVNPLDFEVLLSRYIKSAANFTTVRLLPNGTMSADLHVLKNKDYVIEASSDLLNWKAVSTVHPTSTILTFQDSDVAPPARRFYRVHELAPVPVQPPLPGQTYAPATLENHGMTVGENGQSRDLQFAATGNTFTQFANGTTNAVGTGTYQYTQQGANGGQLILTTTGQDGTNNQVTYNLTFSGANAGTYTFTGNGGQTGSGTFSNLQTITPGSTGGGTGGTGGTGQIPTSLAGHAIDFTAAGQGNEKLTFAGSGNSVTSDAINFPNNVGTYTFTPGTGGRPGTLVVTFPNGDTYNLTMTFTDATYGSWAGTQNFDNAAHPVPAGSSFIISQ